MISVKRLNKYFFRHRQNEIHVIDNVGLELPEKGLIAIFGRSGCGKTTLLNVIGGLDSFDSGSVTYNGASVSEDTDYLRNSSFGYIFQNYCLSRDKTVYENVADILRLCGERDEGTIGFRVLKALSSVGMEKYRNRMPDNLSGGQQQRVAIARAIVKSPKVILADEPTGNLDDANTVAVMDMLKAVSESCLVLLVTHEARLVDYYCDSVIELSDGHIVNVRANSDSEGYRLRSRGDIYLGDLEKKETDCDGVRITYYGEKTDEPVDLKIVNSGGTIYVKAAGERVRIVDGTGEIRLIDGKFDEQVREKKYTGYEALSPLPQKKKSEYGKLFTFRSSLRNGFNTQYSGKKKGKRFMRFCMGMFAAVIVIFAAVYGRKIADLFEVRKTVNDNNIALRVDLPGAEDYMARALENPSDSGVDYFYYAADYGSAVDSERLGISVSYFYSGDSSDVILIAEGTPLPQSVAEKYGVLAGEKKTSDSSVWISKYMADRFIRTSTVSFIKEYGDLIGLSAGNYSIAAVVDCDEPEYYLSDALLQSLNVERLSLKIRKSSDPAAESGKTVYSCFSETVLNAGDKVWINGRQYEISEIRRLYGTYQEWLTEAHAGHADVCGRLFSGGVVSESITDAIRADSEFLDRYSAGDYKQANEEGLVFLYAYRYFDEWVEYCVKNNIASAESPSVCYSVYMSGILDEAKYLAFGDYFSYGTFAGDCFGKYYAVQRYYRAYGKVISPAEATSYYEYTLDSVADRVLWSNVYAETDGLYTPETGDYFELNDSDYALASMGYGKSDAVADGGLYEIKKQGSHSGQDIYSYSYLVAHCSDYGRALSGITERFGAPERYSPERTSPAIITPRYVFDQILSEEGLSILGGVIPFVIVAALLCVCVYFMIRSTLMNRVKDIGIYRAVGVTKKNLRFSFMAETLALTCTSVIPWFAAVSAVLFITIHRSSIVGGTVFYPVWFAALLLAFVVGICLVCGIIPINRLLRKTPAALLAKYDI